MVSDSGPSSRRYRFKSVWEYQYIWPSRLMARTPSSQLGKRRIETSLGHHSHCFPVFAYRIKHLQSKEESVVKVHGTLHKKFDFLKKLCYNIYIRKWNLHSIVKRRHAYQPHKLGWRGFDSRRCSQQFLYICISWAGLISTLAIAYISLGSDNLKTASLLKATRLNLFSIYFEMYRNKRIWIAREFFYI